jgi:hypothetical protein
MSESKRRCLLVILCCLVLSACAFNRHPDQVEDLLAQAFRAAEKHREFEMDGEAALLIGAISAIDTDYPGLQDLTDDLAPAARVGMRRSLLGMNRKFRPQVERSVGVRALLWLPDRLLDLVDLVTVGIHLGPGAFADAHVTRAFQVGAGFRTTGGLGLHDHRSLGMKSQAEAGLNVITVGAQSYAGALMGTTGTRGSSDSSKGHLDAVENKLLIDLWKVRSSKSTLAAYLEAKQWRGPSNREHEPAVPDRYPAGAAGELPASDLPSSEGLPQEGPPPASPALPE